MSCITEAQLSSRNLLGVSKVGGQLKKWGNLPGEGPLILGRCNYDTLSPKRCGDVNVIGQGFSDEAILVVKLDASEVMVT